VHRIKELLRDDPYRYQILQWVANLHQSECYVAAGFIRNMVWDHLHGFCRTALNDVDVIYFDPLSTVTEKELLARLNSAAPMLNWQVKNQALMHIRNSDKPYLSIADAIDFWPEKETAVAVKLEGNEEITVIAPFGVESLFAGLISHNPKRTKAVFSARIQTKQWLEKWPDLMLAK